MLGNGDLVSILVGLGTLLGLARVMGAIAQAVNQPTVLGEIVAGVLLGPTVLDYLCPGAAAWLFPTHGPSGAVLQGITAVSIVAFLFNAGMEVDLTIVHRHRVRALWIGASGIVVPFAMGLTLASLSPALCGHEPDVDRLAFALFFATAMSISALPVIARTLMDLSLFRTDVGLTIISAAMLDDVVGWLMFALVQGVAGTATPASAARMIGLTVAFVGAALALLPIAARGAIPWLERRSAGNGTIVGLAFAIVLVAAGAAEWVGIHAALGAFFVGMAIRSSRRFTADMQAAFGQFTSFILAPLFFASIGLRTNFATTFKWPLVAAVLLIACAGKVIGCTLGACAAGVARREALGIGFAMNSRGAMEIVLGVAALELRLIGKPLFVALVVMAVVTSLMSGPALKGLLGDREEHREELRSAAGIGGDIEPAARRCL